MLSKWSFVLFFFFHLPFTLPPRLPFCFHFTVIQDNLPLLLVVYFMRQFRGAPYKSQQLPATLNSTQSKQSSPSSSHWYYRPLLLTRHLCFVRFVWLFCLLLYFIFAFSIVAWSLYFEFVVGAVVVGILWKLTPQKWVNKAIKSLTSANACMQCCATTKAFETPTVCMSVNLYAWGAGLGIGLHEIFRETF